MKDEHPVTDVVPQIPKSSVQQVFFAQVHTTEVRTGEHVWYLVNSSGFTPQVTEATRARMTRLTENAVHHAMTHNKLVLHTDYGATVRSRATVMAGADGVFGLALPSGQVLTCFTLHTLNTFSMPPGSVLRQGPRQAEWGHRLAPGVYKTITSDVASPRFVVGKGVDTTPGDVRFAYYDRVVAIAGVPA